MEGVSIYTDSHKVISTQYPNPLRAILAIDTALATSNSVAWVPSLHPRVGGDDSDESDEDDDEDEEGEQDGWAQKGRRKAHGGAAGGGLAVVQVIRNGLRFIAPISSDVDPVVPLTFLSKLHEVLESYIDGPVTESSVKDHFDLVLPLLEEMLASGRPVLTASSQLKELVLPPSKAFAKVASAAGGIVGSSAGIGPTGPAGAANATALISSPLPWRRTGIKHSANEIYLDVTESISLILSPTAQIISGSLSGSIACRSRLSGMPDLNMTFADPSLVDDLAVHSCVRTGRWKKDKVVSFVPPDGKFTLATYTVPYPSATKALSLLGLPLTLKPVLTQGPVGGTFHLSLTANTPTPLTNIRIRLPLGRGITGLTGATSGGAFPSPNASSGKSATPGAGRWDTEVDTEGFSVLVWDLEELRNGDRVAVLSGQFLTPPGARSSPALTVTFDCPDSGFSGVRIAALKIAGNSEQYTVYKGVRMRGKGEAEVRCL
ncbi:clathrin adaptor, mu subunit [Meredithblackwellia eburnea MCA 4105]